MDDYFSNLCNEQYGSVYEGDHSLQRGVEEEPGAGTMHPITQDLESWLVETNGFEDIMAEGNVFENALGDPLETQNVRGVYGENKAHEEMDFFFGNKPVSKPKKKHIKKKTEENCDEEEEEGGEEHPTKKKKITRAPIQPKRFEPQTNPTYYDRIVQSFNNGKDKELFTSFWSQGLAEHGRQSLFPYLPIPSITVQVPVREQQVEVGRPVREEPKKRGRKTKAEKERIEQEKEERRRRGISDDNTTTIKNPEWTETALGSHSELLKPRQINGTLAPKNFQIPMDMDMIEKYIKQCVTKAVEEQTEKIRKEIAENPSFRTRFLQQHSVETQAEHPTVLSTTFTNPSMNSLNFTSNHTEIQKNTQNSKDSVSSTTEVINILTETPKEPSQKPHAKPILPVIALTEVLPEKSPENDSLSTQEPTVVPEATEKKPESQELTEEEVDEVGERASRKIMDICKHNALPIHEKTQWPRCNITKFYEYVAGEELKKFNCITDSNIDLVVDYLLQEGKQTSNIKTQEQIRNVLKKERKYKP